MNSEYEIFQGWIWLTSSNFTLALSGTAQPTVFTLAFDNDETQPMEVECAAPVEKLQHFDPQEADAETNTAIPEDLKSGKVGVGFGWVELVCC